MSKVKFEGCVVVVKNVEVSKEFYTRVLGVHIISDFGENVTFTGGFSINGASIRADFIDKKESDIKYGGNNTELYFETEEFDDFREGLNSYDDINLVHDTKEFPWGQRVVRFYDPDMHIIEIGESMNSVIKKYLDSGMSVAEVSAKTMYPETYIEKLK